MQFDLFAACLPGLEPLLAAELTALGAEPVPAPGGCAFRGDSSLLLRAHLCLGTASHVLLRCATFRCLSLSDLERKAASLPWRGWVSRDVLLEVDATAKKSKLYHSGAIAERVENGMKKALGIAEKPKAVPQPTPSKKRASNKPLSAAAKRGRGPNAPKPDAKWLARQAELTAQREAAEAAEAAREAEALALALANHPTVRVSVRFVDDVATISLDTSATPLHRRGYRLDGAKAPLREDIAFAVLQAAGFRKGMALLDPFCGSGTIAIEAACIAAGLPPGRLRPAPLQGFAFADASEWQKLLAQLPAAPTSPIEGSLIVASDRDAGAVQAAIQNAERAGVRAAIDFTCCAISAAKWLATPADAPRDLLVATNPPFGRRVGTGSDLLPLYQTLGHRTARIEGARAAILAHDVNLCRRTGLDLNAAFTTRHGGLSVSCLVS
jgi:putative N6-adenine-specific DNA methylase